MQTEYTALLKSPTALRFLLLELHCAESDTADIHPANLRFCHFSELEGTVENLPDQNLMIKSLCMHCLKRANPFKRKPLGNLFSERQLTSSQGSFKLL